MAPVVINMTPKATHSEITYNKHYPLRAIFGLSITLIIAGIVTIIVQSLLPNLEMALFWIRTGYSGGAFYIGSGICGLFSAKKPSSASIVITMVLASISAFLSLLHVIYGIIGVAKVATGQLYIPLTAGQRLWFDMVALRIRFSIMLVVGLMAGISAAIIVGMARRARNAINSKTTPNASAVYNSSGMMTTVATRY